MRRALFVLALVSAPGCGTIHLQTVPVVTDIRSEGGRLMVEKCVLETGAGGVSSDTLAKIDCVLSPMPVPK